MTVVMTGRMIAVYPVTAIIMPMRSSVLQKSVVLVFSILMYNELKFKTYSTLHAYHLQEAAG